MLKSPGRRFILQTCYISSQELWTWFKLAVIFYHLILTDIIQGYFIGTKAVLWLPWCLWGRQPKTIWANRSHEFTRSKKLNKTMQRVCIFHLYYYQTHFPKKNSSWLIWNFLLVHSECSLTWNGKCHPMVIRAWLQSFICPVINIRYVLFVSLSSLTSAIVISWLIWRFKPRTLGLF